MFKNKLMLNFFALLGVLSFSSIIVGMEPEEGAITAHDFTIYMARNKNFN